MKVFSLTLLFLTVMAAVGSMSGQGLESGISIKRPDFSGKWRLNRAKSSKDQSLLPNVVGIVVTVEQRLPAIRFRITGDALVVGSGDIAGLMEEFTLFPDGRGDIYAEGSVKGTSTPRGMAISCGRHFGTRRISSRGTSSSNCSRTDGF